MPDFIRRGERALTKVQRLRIANGVSE